MPTPVLAPIATAEIPNALPEATDPTRLISVKAGETFDIIVPSNSSTGYRWKIVDDLDEGILQFVAQNYIPERPILPGSGCVGVWIFRGLSAGGRELSGLRI